MRCIFILSLLFILSVNNGHSQDLKPTEIDHIESLISKFKTDIRGPYKDIRWFCKDGTINLPKEPCEDGGVQHARYKDVVVQLGEKNHIYLGQILASTDYEAFWDDANYHSRIKQYMLGKYLASVDDGWINRKGRFYRGAVQAEDEQEWGKSFFNKVLKNNDNINKHFYLLRQAIKDIPHSGDDNVAQLMRSQSKYIADANNDFMNIRIKIHGKPDVTDIEKVKAFKTANSSSLSPELNSKLDELIVTMRRFFEPVKLEKLSTYLKPLTNKEIKAYLNNYIAAYNLLSAKERMESTSDAMWFIRENILNETSSQGRLELFDLSLKLESLIIKQFNDYNTHSLGALIDVICYLSTASAASGYTEIWEWNRLQNTLAKPDKAELTMAELNDMLVAARNQLEWGTGKNSAVFKNVVQVYEKFEPLTHGFLDDRIRGSVALYLGNCIGKLGDLISKESSLNNQVLSIDNQSHVHGLNPGYALGELHVIEGSGEGIEVNPKNIYVFERPPSDLKPISGILTVSEGNLVSHVQLLARNLGIPNAAISSENLQSLKKFSKQRVFYAVSNKGTVIMKPEKDMTETEKKLFSKEEVSHDMITVPVEKIRLDRTTTMSLMDVDATSSGIYCGPKAANLGELKNNFPDHVVDGFVIPFGIFLNHMKQKMPNQDRSYWDYLNAIFNTAREMKAANKPEKEVEDYQLKELAILRQAILDMPLLDSFISDISSSFTNIIKKPFGEQAVFLRSDTNMEDLKSFTGAGLNLTLFNVLEKNNIINGIKEVWASPYTERSFKWRQKYLTNPENVYPSIVVIPGVNNDYSGVMITKGVSSGETDEITAAFSRGVGGAVDGQAAETWSIKNTGVSKLIAPSREPFYNVLPKKGGTIKKSTTFETPILSPYNISQLNDLQKELTNKMMEKGIHGPFDMELGFQENKIWLFQVRPFVENKNAVSSSYLESITPKVDKQKLISLQTKL
ncbi:PEP/pyruvate-binding domain-containing protein [Siansivirga zeaxanthinifaciens]|uniref:Phosphoenolpyruvate synthase n=1 Tax=Siansivirga zeaxanthinifaciens CC-SAMT-1 TaxID=1454006 RepID=A0A0C5WAJ7_9FLAO|nr:PEP/pyruvate-binding domain-containing protein [Siansivirga zeaxanthinifaciens]AJR03327.1 phosphoenolpyruvate synthase [Siansivirga zeaxanthinifaciens CC-SAMT-1]